MRRELANAVAALNKGRRYASAFEWPDKRLKELGVVEELMSAVARSESRVLREPMIHEPDPPDCICFDQSGSRVAIEVTEIVCGKAAALNARGHNVYRHWRRRASTTRHACTESQGRKAISGRAVRRDPGVLVY
jgi:hypothetical protein